MRVGYKTLKTQHCERSEQKIFGLYPLLVTFWGTLGMPTISSIFAEMYVGLRTFQQIYLILLTCLMCPRMSQVGVTSVT